MTAEPPLAFQTLVDSIYEKLRHRNGIASLFADDKNKTVRVVNMDAALTNDSNRRSGGAVDWSSLWRHTIDLLVQPPLI